MFVVEQFLMAKTGREADCEDYIFVSSDYIAVIDGATPKSAMLFNGSNSAHAAVKAIVEVLVDLDPLVDHVVAVDLMTASIMRRYVELDVVGDVSISPHMRMSASIIVYSKSRHELWFVGDCQALVSGRVIQSKKAVDQIASQVRSFYLYKEVIAGVPEAVLLENDVGRAAIGDILIAQSKFQNIDSESFGFGVLDGFSVPRRYINVVSVARNTEIVLATDGYPELKSDLLASEKKLTEVLRADPLMYQIFPSTKGLSSPNVSFDDRAYIKLRV